MHLSRRADVVGRSACRLWLGAPCALVIEDFDLLRDSLCQGLREAGFAVDAAGDGRAGLWHARSGLHDVIVLDLMLPGMDGLTLLRQLREAGSAAHILILTAKDTTAARIKGLNAGADDYLIKPFEFGELLARVRALVRRSYKVKDPLVRVGDLVIDTAARVVDRGSRRIELTAREYALLEYLALRAGQVVTRSEIWDHVYEFNPDANSNVVDVFIGHLRRKIDSPGTEPLGEKQQAGCPRSRPPHTPTLAHNDENAIVKTLPRKGKAVTWFRAK